jgi:hypothetical protein
MRSHIQNECTAIPSAERTRFVKSLAAKVHRARKVQRGGGCAGTG